MDTKAITTSTSISACDVCGRNLLRGEQAEIYIDGDARHTVCELCTSRAIHGGWLREGELPDYGDASARVDRRRSLLSRLRSRRGNGGSGSAGPAPAPEFLDDPEEMPQPPLRAPAPAAAPVPTPAPVRAESPARAGGRSRQREPRQVKEPRHVRAVPTSSEHKILSAIDSFNASEHPRTVAGISRSLGLPEATIIPLGPQSSVVHVVVAWELCWYRYELDLSDEVPTVRVATQGYELSELSPEDRRANASADERGKLELDG